MSAWVGDVGFDESSQPANTRFDGTRPMAVAKCADERDVVLCVDWAREHGVRRRAFEGARAGRREPRRVVGADQGERLLDQHTQRARQAFHCRGHSPRRIRAALKISKTDYDSARKRLRRTLLKEGLTCAQN